jgi:hypothetical protein
LTVGPGFIALPATWLTLIGIPAAAVLLFGQALCAGGCAAVIGAAVLVLLQPVAALLSSLQITRARYRYRATHAGPGDLDQLYRHWHENYGPEIVERAEYEQHLKKNPGISFKVLKYDSKDRRGERLWTGCLGLAFPSMGLMKPFAEWPRSGRGAAEGPHASASTITLSSAVNVTISDLSGFTTTP